MYQQIIKISTLLSILIFSSGCMFKSDSVSIPVTFIEETEDMNNTKVLNKKEAVLTEEEYDYYYKDLVSGKKQKIDSISNLLSFKPEKTTKKCEKNESDKVVYSNISSYSYIKSIKTTEQDRETTVMNVETGELLKGNDYIIEFCLDENGVIIGEFNLNVYEIKDEDLK